MSLLMSHTVASTEESPWVGVRVCVCKRKCVRERDRGRMLSGRLHSLAVLNIP
jgi:hypothetical protein